MVRLLRTTLSTLLIITTILPALFTKVEAVGFPCTPNQIVKSLQSSDIDTVDVSFLKYSMDKAVLKWDAATTGGTAFYEVRRFRSFDNSNYTNDYSYFVRETGDSQYSLNVEVYRPGKYFYDVVTYSSSCKYNVTSNATSPAPVALGSITGLVFDIESLVVLKDKGVINEIYGKSEDSYYQGDFNGDGYEDLMIATTRLDENKLVDGDLAWYFMKGTENGFVDGGKWNGSFGVNTDNYYVADLDGNGKDDILVSTARINFNKNVNNDLAWYLMKSNGGTFSDGGRINDSFGVNVDYYYKSDFNGDGRDDILVSTERINGDSNNSTPDLAWYLMTSSGIQFVDGGQLNDSFGLGTDNYYVGDLNADGLDDIYIAANRGSISSLDKIEWYAMVNNKFKFTDGGKIGEVTQAKNSKTYIKDFDLDGVDDILVAEPNAENYLDWNLVDVKQQKISGTKKIVRENYGSADNLVFVGKFTESNGSDVVLGVDVNGAYKWYGLYSLPSSDTDSSTQKNLYYSQNYNVRSLYPPRWGVLSSLFINESPFTENIQFSEVPKLDVFINPVGFDIITEYSIPYSNVTTESGKTFTLARNIVNPATNEYTITAYYKGDKFKILAIYRSENLKDFEEGETIVKNFIKGLSF